ncbi:MAG: glycosyltransferase [Nitrospira sp.]|nr:glycosyltransferase [Nitrospira sp.]
MPTVSIIVRTKNEERWIGHCLSMVFKQDIEDIEVIVVDNASTDHTVEIAKRYPIKTLISIERFRPGHVINEGIRASSGEYIVCLSAHCVPKATDWLRCLLANFRNDPMLAGVYGRQLPVSFTDPLDKRDLLIVFGLDRRIQVKDYFFHNANSMIRRSVWDEIPFDEEVTNIEDRVWGKAVVSLGYHLVYDPDAAVYHYHGLHQGNTPERAKGVVSIIEKVDVEVVSDLPDSLKPEHANIAAIVPVLGRIAPHTQAAELLRKTVDALAGALYVNAIYVLAYQSDLDTAPAQWIDRSRIPEVDTIGMDELLQQTLRLIEAGGDFPDAVLYVNYEYLLRPADLFDELIVDAQYKGYDTVFSGFLDYGHYWFRDKDDQFRQSDASMKARVDRQPVFRALYGLGTVSAATVIRRGQFVGGKIGILPINDLRYTFRLRDVGDRDWTELFVHT